MNILDLIQHPCYQMNETIKQHWVALGPRNYGKSIEWKLEGDPWDTEGLYSDQTRGVYLLCLLLDVIQPLGWRLVSSADISAKNLDANDRGYALVGKPEDMHTWFFLYEEALRRRAAPAANNARQQHQHMAQNQHNQACQCQITFIQSEIYNFDPRLRVLDSERGKFLNKCSMIIKFP